MASRAGVRTHRISFDFYITPGVQLLIIANVAVYILEAFIQYFGGASGLQLASQMVRPGPCRRHPLLRVWQPFTYLFLHDINSIWHIVINMFTLWMFGRELELVWGRDRFLRYYFLTGVGAGMINVIVNTVPMLWGQRKLLCADHRRVRRHLRHPHRLRHSVSRSPRIYHPDSDSHQNEMDCCRNGSDQFFGTFGLGDNKVSHICHLGGMLDRLSLFAPRFLPLPPAQRSLRLEIPAQPQKIRRLHEQEQERAAIPPRPLGELISSGATLALTLPPIT